MISCTDLGVSSRAFRVCGNIGVALAFRWKYCLHDVNIQEALGVKENESWDNSTKIASLMGHYFV